MGMRKSNQEERYQFFHREGANKMAKYGSAAIFIPIIIPAPFPTLVNIPEQQNQMMTNGDLFTRNVYVFCFCCFLCPIQKEKITKKPSSFGISGNLSADPGQQRFCPFSSFSCASPALFSYVCRIWNYSDYPEYIELLCAISYCHIYTGNSMELVQTGRKRTCLK